jgi:hypothetical protein
MFRVSAGALKPDFSATDRTANGTENPQDDADDDENSADRVQNRDTGEVPDQEKNDAQDDHAQSDP